VCWDRDLFIVDGFTPGAMCELVFGMTRVIRSIVWHDMEGFLDGAIKRWNTGAAGAHLCILETGEVVRTVRLEDVAWHAGNWDYNTRSIGIEHEGWVDQPQWLTDRLYAGSAALTKAICNRYGIPKDRSHIIGHVEVPGTTHTDPGLYWDWTKYMRLVNN